MRADILGYSAVLAASLGIAYWASLPVSETDRERVTIWDQKPAAIQSINYTGAEQNVTVARQDGDRFLVTFERKAKEEGKPAESETFVAGEELQDLLSSFNPFQALREISSAKPEDKAEFGLSDSKEKIKVTAQNATLDMTIGKKSYGSRNLFAMLDNNPKVYLIDGKFVQTLVAAKSKLYERRLYSINLEDVNKVSLSTGAKQKVLSHETKDEQGNLKWSDDVKGAAAKPAYESWMDKVSKLRVVSFANAEQQAQLDSTKEFLTVTMLQKDKPVETLVMKKIMEKTPAAIPDPKSPPPEKVSYWIKSDFLKSYAKVATPRIEPIEKDIPTIME